MSVETFKFVKEVPCVDADGKPIKEGSVLRHVTEDDRGVVVAITRAGDWGTPLDMVGDLHIQKSPGCTRVTNKYSTWRHIPHNEQTYSERLLSWQTRPYIHDPFYNISVDEERAINGIMALLPDDLVDWDNELVDSLSDALRMLVRHLSKSSEE